MEFLACAGQYVVGRKLGSGRSGVVRAIVDVKSGKEILAIKTVKLGEKCGSTLQERNIMHELESHPHVIKFWGAVEDPQSRHLFLELCSYGTLYDYLYRSGRLDEHKAAKLFHQVLLALSHCHSHAIVHSDIKPENIFISCYVDDAADGTPELKLGDFGMALKLHQNRRTEGFCGSPLYMVPEVARGEPYDFKVDLWSAGVILYTMLSGFMPYECEDEMDTLRLVALGEPVELCSEIWSGVSQSAKELISMLLQHDPAKRLSAEAALNHPWILQHTSSILPLTLRDLNDRKTIEIGKACGGSRA
eukprot:TRINITY_DN11177_c0_g1_i4.p1 TRINITY_DN11177_c0_g1~~TRINITY_DN11177_c0_g1_i4.p1  ORF type:complete len:304 (+),score=17.73 TRINITY_DN11177_c0_g1_i4:122-1033(+)